MIGWRQASVADLIRIRSGSADVRADAEMSSGPCQDDDSQVAARRQSLQRLVNVADHLEIHPVPSIRPVQCHGCDGAVDLDEHGLHFLLPWPILLWRRPCLEGDVAAWFTPRGHCQTFGWYGLLVNIGNEVQLMEPTDRKSTRLNSSH